MSRYMQAKQSVSRRLKVLGSFPISQFAEPKCMMRYMSRFRHTAPQRAIRSCAVNIYVHVVLNLQHYADSLNLFQVVKRECKPLTKGPKQFPPPLKNVCSCRFHKKFLLGNVFILKHYQVPVHILSLSRLVKFTCLWNQALMTKQTK